MRSRYLTISFCLGLWATTFGIAQDNPAGNGSAPPTNPPSTAPPTELTGGSFSPPGSTFNPNTTDPASPARSNQIDAQANQMDSQNGRPNPNDPNQSFTPLSQLMNKAQSNGSPTNQQQSQGSQLQPYRMQQGGTLQPNQPTNPPNFPAGQVQQSSPTNGSSFYQQDDTNTKMQRADQANFEAAGSNAIRPVNHIETGQQQDQNPKSQFGGAGGFQSGGVNNNSANSNFGNPPAQFGSQSQGNRQQQFGDSNNIRSAALSNDPSSVLNRQSQNVASQFNTNAPTSNLQQLVNEFDVLSVQGQLPGVPKTLMEVIASSPSHLHTQVSVAYWDLFNAWAKYRRANDWASRLHSIQDSQVLAERTLVNAARSASLNEAKQCENRLRAAQRTLASMVPALQNNDQVLPADLPLLGSYETRYEHFASIRQFDPRYARIHQQLPEIRSLMNNQANTVVQFNQAYAQVMQGYANRQMPVSSVLETIRLAREEDNKLIDSVTQYNKSIAHYAFYVAPGAQSPEKTVKMLIKVSPESMELARAAGLVQRDTNVRQASLTNETTQYSKRGSPGNSFAPPTSIQNYR